MPASICADRHPGAGKHPGSTLCAASRVGRYQAGLLDDLEGDGLGEAAAVHVGRGNLCGAVAEGHVGRQLKARRWEVRSWSGERRRATSYARAAVGSVYSARISGTSSVVMDWVGVASVVLPPPIDTFTVEPVEPIQSYSERVIRSERFHICPYTTLVGQATQHGRRGPTRSRASRGKPVPLPLPVYCALPASPVSPARV